MFIWKLVLSCLDWLVQVGEPTYRVLERTDTGGIIDYVPVYEGKLWGISLKLSPVPGQSWQIKDGDTWVDCEDPRVFKLPTWDLRDVLERRGPI